MKLSDRTTRKRASTIRVAVSVDGRRIGSLHFDCDSLWKQFSNFKLNLTSIEWIDPACYEDAVRTDIILMLVRRIKSRLSEIVAEETADARRELQRFRHRLDSAANECGYSRQEIERLATESGCSVPDFYSFFWKYLLNDRATVDLREEWQSSLHG
jgi:hypothetical protein